MAKTGWSRLHSETEPNRAEPSGVEPFRSGERVSAHRFHAWAYFSAIESSFAIFSCKQHACTSVVFLSLFLSIYSPYDYFIFFTVFLFCFVLFYVTLLSYLLTFMEIANKKISNPLFVIEWENKWNDADNRERSRWDCCRASSEYLSVDNNRAAPVRNSSEWCFSRQP